MGEWHQGTDKVIVEFTPQDLGLSAAEQLKLKKLVGARYNPERDVIKISCDMFDNGAQNKRYLGDMVEKLVAEAKVCPARLIFTLTINDELC
jgi:small subunit ribosomal protein S35